MIPRRFLSIASALSFFPQACSAQTITLTTQVSACSATYTSGTSTTVIQSTVTVQPTPWTDAAANGGAPFVIRLQQVDVSGYPDQDTAPYWLTANGNTTTNSSLAAVYTINEGRLANLNGSHVATNFNVVDQAFGVTDYDLPINTTFSVNNRMLNWTNALFTNGKAQFYKLPPGLLDNALILAKFLGPMEAQRSWSPVILYVEPLINNGTGVVSSSTASEAPGAQLSTVSNLLPNGGSSSVASGSSAAASSSAAGVGSSIASKLSSQLSSVASSASSVSPMASGMSSMSAPSMMESMASSSAASVLSSIAAAASSPLVGGSSSATGSASTSLTSVSGIGPVVVASSSTSGSAASTSSMPPQTTYSCPMNNNEMVQSNMGGMYQLGCNEALSGGDAQLAGSATNFNGCMTICDQTDGCTAWTYDGVSNCYIETGTSSSGTTFQASATQGTVSGIRNVPARPGSVGSASSSSSISSSAVISAALSGSSLSSTVPSAVKSASSVVQPISSALSAGSSSGVGISSSIAPVLSSIGLPSSATSIVSSVGVGSSSSSAPGVVVGGSLSTASSVAPVLSSALVSSSTQPASSAASAAASQIPYSCPSVNNQTVADPNGVEYHIGCNQDTNSGGTLGGASPDFNGCMTMCDKVSGCGGWTWTTNGNCYLKNVDPSTLAFVPAAAGIVAGIRYSPQPVSSDASSSTSATSASSAASSTASQSGYSCPSVNNQTVLDSNGVAYEIRCNSDTTLGGTYGGPSPDFNGCMPMCDNTSGCGGWTYTDTKNCYLKLFDPSTIAFTPTTADFVAGIRYVASDGPPPTCPSMNGTTITDARGARYSITCAADGNGALITTVTVNGDGIKECFAACDNTPSCGAFTYSGDSTMTKGTCYLKTTAGQQTTEGVADTIAEGILVSPATIAAPSSSSTASAVVAYSASSASAASSPAPTASNGAGTGTGGSGTGTGSGSGSAASSSSASASACTGPPLPSGSGSPTVINPDGSTSNYTGVLANPTRCDFGDPIDTEEDDSYCEIDLPFNMNIYGGSSAQTFASTNGVSSSLVSCS
jgi:hypothetical protein